MPNPHDFEFEKFDCQDDPAIYADDLDELEAIDIEFVYDLYDIDDDDLEEF